jgi:hypothetical protein
MLWVLSTLLYWFRGLAPERNPSMALLFVVMRQRLRTPVTSFEGIVMAVVQLITRDLRIGGVESTLCYPLGGTEGDIRGKAELVKLGSAGNFKIGPYLTKKNLKYLTVIIIQH